MKINFTKMHGIGNDYIYINCLEKELPNPEELAKAMSPRHFSVGADGVVLICKSDIADAKMRMFNADGSEGKMCGNASRCIGKFLYDNGYVDKTDLTLETLSGVKTLKLKVKDGRVSSVTVDMGIADFEPKNIPLLHNGPMINESITVCGSEYNMTAVSMGNPHAVCFVEDVENLNLEKIGPSFENLEIFPDRVNTEFVKVKSKKELIMRVWERGSGETYACGTGASATAAAAVKNGICDKNTEIGIKLLGGVLKITVDDNYRVFMEGEAKKVYEGVYEFED